MIIILFGGGLGNQMFQYALGRHLSTKNNQSLKLDNTRYDPGLKIQDSYKNLRTFGLSNFNIAGELTSKEEVDAFFKTYKSEILIEKILKKLKINFFRKNYYKKHFVRQPEENSQTFDKRILEFPYKNAYFRGFWQSEKYFEDIRKILLQDFKVKTAPDEYNSNLLKKIKSANSINLHIRRGDITNESSTVGTLSLDYYKKAIKIINNKVKNPNFFIFSDDIEWVKSNFKINFPSTFVNNPLEKDYEDIRLMSYCKHHIIANSTFSWWGAWLSENPDKIIIAPERYAQKIDRPNPDYYPESWILIK